MWLAAILGGGLALVLIYVVGSTAYELERYQADLTAWEEDLERRREG